MRLEVILKHVVYVSIAVLGSVHCKFTYSYLYESKSRLILLKVDYKILNFPNNPSLKVLKKVYCELQECNYIFSLI